MLSNNPITKDHLDSYLKELAKEYKRLSGTHVPAEIILIGGASIIVNYGFREMTYDMDAIIQASSSMKDAINCIGDKHNLPNGWINTDFINTKSYSPKLIEHSKYYKTFSNIVSVRTVSEEYLVAMKLMAGRQYKNDLSDVIGIIIEQQKKNMPLNLTSIKTAVEELYGSYDAIPNHSREFVEAAFMSSNLDEFYTNCRNDEIDNKNALLEFKEDYPDAISEDKLETILKLARSKKESGKKPL